MAKHSFLLFLCVSFILASTISLVCDANDQNMEVHIVYMGSFPKEAYSPTSHHLSMLQQVIDDDGIDAANHLIHSYKRSFNGFAAMLTDQQREKLSNMEGVVSVFPSKTLNLQTTRSWDFMGLHNSIKRNQTGESDVIIGVIDSGIWPESDSFNDEGFGPIPKKWNGTCAGGKNFTCNNKMIGARFYTNKYGDTNSSRDIFGHGSHTASIAAGNKVEGVSFYGLAQGTARGGVPSARVAAYKVCDPNGSCVEADILAAFDDSIADGVDIISISLGGSKAVNFFNDSLAIGSFHAMKKGILTVNSGGNDGPELGTTTSVAPWLLSVAASTTDRHIVDKVVLGNGKTLVGNSVNTFTTNGTKLPIAVRNADPTHCIENTSPEDCSCLDSVLMKGKVVLCSQAYGQVEAYYMGASAAIVEAETDVSHITFYPAVPLDSKDYAVAKSYINSTEYPEAEILKSTEIFDDHNAPKVTNFSSRGPNSIVVEVLKPDISAPGAEILAAYSFDKSPSMNAQDKRRVKYNILSGTSMSCPHVAGIAAYVKTFHPDWSPAAIKSAIMTTAKPMNGTYNLTGHFAYGSGHVNPQAALDPGLVYDISEEDYVQMLCNYGYSGDEINMITGENTSCPRSSERSLVKDLNYPAIVIQVEPMKSFSVKVHRTVTNVGFANSTYKANFLPDSEIKTVSFAVEPQILSFKSLNEKQSFVVIIEGEKPKEFAYSLSLQWTDGTHSVTSPIIVL